MDKKSDELKCLNYAIEKCNTQHGMTKKIAQLLSGQDIDRDIDERPDFVRLSKMKDTGNNIVIGIEHFRVDHYSEKMKKQRVSSLGVQDEKRMHELHNTWKPQISEDEDIPEGVIVSMSSILAQLLTHQMQSSYNAFIEAFKYSLSKHLDSVDGYHSVLNKYAGNSDKPLAFLIEIHSDFRRLFFHDKRGIHYGESTIPLFEDIVKMLENIDSRKVHYLILCFGSTVYNDNTKVIAVPTRNLRKQLAKLNIPVYEYAGHDIFLKGFQTPFVDFNVSPSYERKEDKINFYMTVESRDISDEKKLEMIVNMYRYIKQIEQNNLNFATTNLVEMIYYLYDEYLPKSKNLSTDSIINLIRFIAFKNSKEINRKFVEFKRKCGIGENDEED